MRGQSGKILCHLRHGGGAVITIRYGIADAP